MARDRGPPLCHGARSVRARARARIRIRTRARIRTRTRTRVRARVRVRGRVRGRGRVQGLEREGEVLQLVLRQVRRVPCPLVGQEVLPTRGRASAASSLLTAIEKNQICAYLRISEQRPQPVGAAGRIGARVPGPPRTARPAVFVLLQRAVWLLGMPMAMFPL